MTQNQINYWKLQEDRRHNQETESLGRDTLGENKRHNLENESIDWFKGREQHRHNVVTEQETERHNKADESVRWFTAQETHRHNEADEDIRKTANTINQTRAEEEKRHNEADEQLKREGFSNNLQVAAIRAAGQAASRVLPLFFAGKGGDVQDSGGKSNDGSGLPPGALPGQQVFGWAGQAEQDNALRTPSEKTPVSKPGVRSTSVVLQATGILGLGAAAYGATRVVQAVGQVARAGAGGPANFLGGGGQGILFNENR